MEEVSLPVSCDGEALKTHSLRPGSTGPRVLQLPAIGYCHSHYRQIWTLVEVNLLLLSDLQCFLYEVTRIRERRVYQR